MVRDQWLALAARFPGIELDEFVVMPDHFHAILFIRDCVERILIQTGTSLDPAEDPAPASVRAALVAARTGKNRAGTSPAPASLSPTLGQIIGAYKSITTHEYILGVNHHNWPPFNKRLWQRNYYERIVCTTAALDRIRAYLRANPLRQNPTC